MQYVIKIISNFKRKYKRIKLKLLSNFNETKEIKMEFLSFLFLALAVFIAWKKPEKESGERHIDWDSLEGDIFQLEYLLLTKGIDAPDDEYGTHAARILAQARRRGMKTFESA